MIFNVKLSSLVDIFTLIPSKTLQHASVKAGDRSYTMNHFGKKSLETAKTVNFT